MNEATVYQTLRDKENPDEVEKEGPFPCKYETAWLGKGFYFWDTHIQLAHWWGKMGHIKYGFKYIVCRAQITMNSKECWDLHGIGNHLLEFNEICDEIVKIGLKSKDALLVVDVINYLIKKGVFSYNAIRALGVETIPHRIIDPKIVFRVKFRSNKTQYLDVYPPVQICLLNRDALNLRNYTIISPQHYVTYS